MITISLIYKKTLCTKLLKNTAQNRQDTRKKQSSTSNEKFCRPKVTQYQKSFAGKENNRKVQKIEIR